MLKTTGQEAALPLPGSPQDSGGLVLHRPPGKYSSVLAVTLPSTHTAI